MTIDRSKKTAPAPLLELQKSGDPATRVDFLILGDGYTAAEAAKFEKDARRLMEICSPRPRSKSAGATSMFGDSVRLRHNRASPGPPPASTRTPRWAPATTPSVPNDTC